MNKLKFLIMYSFKRKVNSKWFLIANVLLALVIVMLLNIDSIIRYFGGDFESKVNIHIIDNTEKSYDLFDSYLSLYNNMFGDDDKYVVTLFEGTKEDSIEMLENDEDESSSIVLIFDLDEENVIAVTMISNDFLNLLDIPAITTTVNNVKTALAIERYEFSEEQIFALTSPVDIDRVILNEERTSDENVGIIMSTVFPIIILPFFMLSIFLVQMIGAEINDEKTTRGMEIIISNVSPGIHLASKAIAGNLFVIVQGLLFVGYFLLGIFTRGFVTKTSFSMESLFGSEFAGILSGVFNSSFMETLRYTMPLVLLLMLLTFVAYSLLAGILSSMTTNTEDFQHIQTPIMIVMVLGYYLAIMAGLFEGALFIRILAYIPFISAILSPSLLVMGQFTVIDFMISIGMVALFIFIFIKFGLKVYKVGILNYSSGGMFKKMLEALKG